MQRLSAYLTLVPTVFTFIAIVLINIGGVSPGTSSRYLAPERNRAFNLVNWNYSITPEQTYSSYNFHAYLNRLCIGTKNVYQDTVQETCRNGRIVTKILDGRQLPSPNALVGNLAPFRFSTVNLNIPFAFYILTAIFVFCLLPTTFVAAGGKGRKAKLAAFLLSGLALLPIFAATITITVQMVRLKNQIENNTIRFATTRSFGGFTTATYFIEVQNVSLGSMVLGLTWTSTILMLVGTVTWILIWARSGKDRLVEAKEQKYVER